MCLLFLNMSSPHFQRWKWKAGEKWSSSNDYIETILLKKVQCLFSSSYTGACSVSEVSIYTFSVEILLYLLSKTEIQFIIRQAWLLLISRVRATKKNIVIITDTYIWKVNCPLFSTIDMNDSSIHVAFWDFFFFS